MYNSSFIGFLQHMPDQSMLLLYPALSWSSSVSCRLAVLHLRTGNVHKIPNVSISPMPSEFQFKESPTCPRNSSSKNLLFPSGFQKAICHDVWIISGIAQSQTHVNSIINIPDPLRTHSKDAKLWSFHAIVSLINNELVFDVFTEL